MLISLCAMIPRYVVGRYHGEQDLGAFVAIASLVLVSSTIVNAITQATTPRLARYCADGDWPAVQRLLIALTTLSIVIAAAGIAIATVWGRQILVALYRPEYAAHVDTLVLVMIAAGVSYVGAVLGQFVTAARLFRVQLPLLAGVAIATVLSSAERIPAHGLVGAAQANIVTALVNLVGVALVSLYAMRQLVHCDRHRSAPPQQAGA
jgi:O-antigen/teichoic acid export membrane protein